MDFFGRQDRARRQTRRLIVGFALAVLVVSAAVSVVVTLLLQALDRVAAGAKDKPVVYVSGEESNQQVGLRARRLGLTGAGVRLLAETRVAATHVVERERVGVAFALAVDQLDAVIRHRHARQIHRLFIAIEQVVIFQQVGFVGHDLLHPHRPLLIPRARQAQRLVPGGAVGVHEGQQEGVVEGVAGWLLDDAFLI